MSDKRGKKDKKNGNENGKKDQKKPDNSPPAEPKLKPMRSRTVDVGKKAVLTCELEAGNPLPKIKWYKDGIEITGKNKPKNTKIKKKGRTSVLQFKRPTESDTATYTCEAVNNLGKVSTTGNLTVIKSPIQSTTPSVRTSSHVTPCNESEKSYCVNGGDCFTLEVTSGTTKKLCRCPNEFTGDRCQTYVMASFYKHLGIEFMAEELYQKRVLTITGICIALLVVGIMCVVAYCKTKKQRQKLHDRLRQSLRERNAMATMANGPQIHPPHPPPENIQLVNQYISKTAAPAQHAIEKETETSFSPSQYTSSAHQSTTVTHTSSQSWMNSKHENIVSESRSALVMSSVEGSRQGTPSHRGRLNATGGARDLGAYLKSTRETPDSNRDSPYSERYVSAMTTPTNLSHVELLSPLTPGSPPSETSAPLSSLATSVPSVAVSPSVDEDRPLLFLTPPRPRDKQRAGCGNGGSGGHGNGNCRGHSHAGGGTGAHQCSKRNSAHYNHGQDPSPPPSPLHIAEDDEYESTQEYEAPGVAAATTPAALPTRPPSPAKKLPGSRHANSASAAGATKRTKPNGVAVGAADTVARQAQAEPAVVAAPANSESSSEESSSSDESETEDERVGEDTPFLSIQNPAAGGPEAPGVTALRPLDGSRTNPALRLSPQEDLQVRLSSVMTNQDPIAV